MTDENFNRSHLCLVIGFRHEQLVNRPPPACCLKHSRIADYYDYESDIQQLSHSLAKTDRR